MRIQDMTLTLALVCGVLSPLAASPASAAAKAYASTTSANTNLSATGGVPTTVLTLAVPAGSWLVTAKADGVNFGAADYMRCGIKAGATIEDQSTSTTQPASAVVNLESQAAVTVSGTTAVTLYCQHDDNTSGEYVDAHASLIALKVPGIVRQ
jgi:hypothetical protein